MMPKLNAWPSFSKPIGLLCTKVPVFCMKFPFRGSTSPLSSRANIHAVHCHLERAERVERSGTPQNHNTLAHKKLKNSHVPNPLF